MQLDFSQNINIPSLSPNNQFEEKVISFLREWFSDSETVSVQTSGSTGAPKVFEIEKQRMLNSARMTCDFLGLKKGDAALLCLPVEYISGKMMLVRAFERGLKVIVEEPSSQPLKNLEEQIDFCAMTPLQVQHSLDKIHLVKNLIIGGSAISESLKSQICHAERSRSISFNKVFETYGMSETLSHIALKEILPSPEAYFTALDDVEISLDDRNCLKIFAQKLNPEVLQTNDIVELLDDKQFKFLGRFDNVINSGGVKIFAEELEAIVKSQLDEFDFTNELVLLGKPDEILGEKLVLVIEDSEDCHSERSRRLKSKISSLRIKNKFHIPKEIVFLEKFPRSENGKVLRKEILKKIL